MKCIIMDLEGVLTNNLHRVKHAQQGDYKTYNSLFSSDGVNLDMVALAKAFQGAGFSLMISTGKTGDDIGRIEAQGWLLKNHVQYAGLLMREKDDFSSSPQVKREHVGRIRGQNVDIVLAVDDRMKNIEMFRSLSIPALYYATEGDH